jgi:membrane protein DedA with SNARE-associated domain
MLDRLEDWVLSHLQSLFDQFGWWGVAGMMAFENATGITPSEIILGFAGWLLLAAHQAPVAAVFLGGLVATLGSVLGASLTYWAARLGGRPVIYRMARRVRIDPSHIARVEEKFQRWGASLVFFGRVIPGVRTLVSIPAGLAKMPYPAFLLATAAGAYIWCTLLIGLGYLLGTEWPVISTYLKQFAPAFIVAAVYSLVVVWLVRRQRAASLPLDVEPGRQDLHDA